MKQHFKYLRDEREAIETAKRQQEEAERQARDREMQLHQAKKGSADQYDHLVMGLLGQLREAAYPDQRLHRDEYRYSWGIGHQERQAVSHHRDAEMEMVWHDEVKVTLLFDAANAPSGFVCTRGTFRGSERKCGLSETELVEALKELHPPGSARLPKQQQYGM